MESASPHRFPCASCGSDMRFSPANGVLKCVHCGNEQPLAGGTQAAEPIGERDYLSALHKESDAASSTEIRTVTCENCGAHVEFDPDNHATECPFCASPVVIGTGKDRQIKPAAVLPFQLEETQARNRMVEWLGGLWFAPNGLQEYARKGRQMQGIYVPYWTYDAQTRTDYTGQRGTIYYVTKQVQVMVDGKMQTRTQQVQKIRWRGVRGRVARFFDDILVLGSTSLPKKYTDALAPWDLSALEPYQTEYLAGFLAESYTVSLEDGFEQARNIMNSMILRDIRFDIGGDRQQVDSVHTDISEQTFKHILLPVWLAAYKYRGKTYRFVVNGQSGTVQGERPYSGIKIALAVLAGLCVAAGVGYFIAISR